jgi:alkylation response protein AidB-like acyl-CoA dehydrogenase
MSETIEPLEDFRARARRWIRANLERRSAEVENSHRPDRDRDRRIQAQIHDAGFSGLAVPRTYGGAGLTLEHQRIWAEETDAYVRPTGVMVSLGIMLPTLLDHGTEAAKQRHIPRLLRGEESWIQLLSEPSGGSDMAGALTRATRRGDVYVINGSKMWSSNADHADYGMCLARVNWDAPKHQGLGMFIVPLKHERVEIRPIIPAQGGEPHFFIEYFDDVEVPADYVLGGEGEGWTVAQRLLFHERSATAGVAYGYGMGGGESEGRSSWRLNVAEVARRHGSIDAPEFSARIAEDYIDLVVSTQRRLDRRQRRRRDRAQLAEGPRCLDRRRQQRNPAQHRQRTPTGSAARTGRRCQGALQRPDEGARRPRRRLTVRRPPIRTGRRRC